MGFKWFVDGLVNGSLGFAGEESAGASFLRAGRHRRGRPTRTASIAALLSAEITARSGRDPGEIYAGSRAKYGAPVYERIDAPATPAQKARLAQLSPTAFGCPTELAGEASTPS